MKNENILSYVDMYKEKKQSSLKTGKAFGVAFTMAKRRFKEKITSKNDFKKNYDFNTLKINRNHNKLKFRKMKDDREDDYAYERGNNSFISQSISSDSNIETSNDTSQSNIRFLGSKFFPMIIKDPLVNERLDSLDMNKKLTKKKLATDIKSETIINKPNTALSEIPLFGQKDLSVDSKSLSGLSKDSMIHLGDTNKDISNKHSILSLKNSDLGFEEETIGNKFFDIKSNGNHQDYKEADSFISLPNPPQSKLGFKNEFEVKDVGKSVLNVNEEATLKENDLFNLEKPSKNVDRGEHLLKPEEKMVEVATTSIYSDDAFQIEMEEEEDSNTGKRNFSFHKKNPGSVKKESIESKDLKGITESKGMKESKELKDIKGTLESKELKERGESKEEVSDKLGKCFEERMENFGGAFTEIMAMSKLIKNDPNNELIIE